MKESRLFRIIYYLLDKGHATAPELASEFEVSVRTVYRDIDALSAAGIPVYAETGRNGGIFLQDHFVLDKTLFSEHEKLDILSALQSLSVTGHAYEKEILTKLSALFDIRQENWFEVDFSRWGCNTKDNIRFEILKNAVVSHQSLNIAYVDSSGVKSRRDINPLKMLFKSKEWYIKAFCPGRQNFRIFKFNRIMDIQPTGKVFIPVEFPNSQDISPESYQKIVLRFSKEMAYRVYDEFGADEIEVQEDGLLIVSINMPEDAWLVSYLLSFGANVDLLEPLYLREVLANEARKIYEKNTAGKMFKSQKP